MGEAAEEPEDRTEHEVAAAGMTDGFASNTIPLSVEGEGRKGDPGQGGRS